MRLRFLALGFVLGCAGSTTQELPPERAADVSYWIQELRDDAHPNETDRAAVIRRYLDHAPAETKAELTKLTDFLSPCSQRFRLADTLHRIRSFDAAIDEYHRLSDEGCQIGGAELARRIAFATIDARPEEFPTQPERLNAFLGQLLWLEGRVEDARDRDQMLYEIAIVQYMVSQPDPARLNKLADRSLSQLISGDMTEIEGVYRTIVVLTNKGGADLGDPELLGKAVQVNNRFHGYFGYSVL